MSLLASPFVRNSHGTIPRGRTCLRHMQASRQDIGNLCSIIRERDQALLGLIRKFISIHSIFTQISASACAPHKIVRKCLPSISRSPCAQGRNNVFTSPLLGLKRLGTLLHAMHRTAKCGVHVMCCAWLFFVSIHDLVLTESKISEAGGFACRVS